MKDGGEPTAWGTKVSGLALVNPCGGKQKLPSIGVQTDIDLSGGDRAIHSQRAFSGGNEVLRDVITLQDLFENAAG